MDANLIPSRSKNHLAGVALITNKGFTRFQKEFKLEDVPNTEADGQQASRYRLDCYRRNTPI